MTCQSTNYVLKKDLKQSIYALDCCPQRSTAEVKKNIKICFHIKKIGLRWATLKSASGNKNVTERYEPVTCGFHSALSFPNKK